MKKWGLCGSKLYRYVFVMDDIGLGKPKLYPKHQEMYLRTYALADEILSWANFGWQEFNVSSCGH